MPEVVHIEEYAKRLQKEFIAFDSLPPEIRKFLTQCLGGISAITALNVLQHYITIGHDKDTAITRTLQLLSVNDSQRRREIEERL